MSINPEPYRDVLAPEPLDFTTWPTRDIKRHVQELLLEKEVANFRRADELERQIGHACFELVQRARDYDRFQQVIGAQPEVAC